jgi:hypothetical protein
LRVELGLLGHLLEREARPRRGQRAFERQQCQPAFLGGLADFLW